MTFQKRSVVARRAGGTIPGQREARLPLNVRTVMKKWILRALVLTLFWPLLPAYAGDTPDKAVKIDKFMAQYADCCSFTGTVLVSDHDRVIFKKGYGLADREWNIPNTPDVKFRLGSITKQFTSMLIMQQVAKGSIKLDGQSPTICPTTGRTPVRKLPSASCLATRPGYQAIRTILNFFPMFRATTLPSTI